MSASISSIHYCPVKSVSFQNIENCEIKRNVGIVGDRIFAFSKDLEPRNVELFEKMQKFYHLLFQCFYQFYIDQYFEMTQILQDSNVLKKYLCSYNL